MRLRNNYVPAVSAVIANSIIGIVIGTVYYRLDESTDSMQARATLLFLAVLQTALSPAFDVRSLYLTVLPACGGSQFGSNHILPNFQIPLMWAQRPIVEKHARYAFYRPVAEMLASFICSLPQKALESVLVHVPIYFMSNLRRDVGAFFVYWLFMFVVLLAMSTLFRMVGSLSKRIEQTLAPNSTMVLFCVVYAGFVVPPAYMVPWLGWVRWVNPISYAYESLMINEVRSQQHKSYEQAGLTAAVLRQAFPVRNSSAGRARLYVDWIAGKGVPGCWSGTRRSRRPRFSLCILEVRICWSPSLDVSLRIILI